MIDEKIAELLTAIASTEDPVSYGDVESSLEKNLTTVRRESPAGIRGPYFGALRIAERRGLIEIVDGDMADIQSVRLTEAGAAALEDI